MFINFTSEIAKMAKYSIYFKRKRTKMKSLYSQNSFRDGFSVKTAKGTNSCLCLKEVYYSQQFSLKLKITLNHLSYSTPKIDTHVS